MNRLRSVFLARSPTCSLDDRRRRSSTVSPRLIGGVEARSPRAAAPSRCAAGARRCSRRAR
ncbi:MAG: hypothetical protein MZV49_04085 [Rhodopseudomonas palustris]|nr:hypothetical protein [Rhodopseudomonas palustris]